RLGRARAEALHRACAGTVAAVLRHCAPRLQAYYAVAEADALGEWPGLPAIEQGAGTLGQRLERVFTALQARHGRVLLLGADAPQLDGSLLARALDWLEGERGRIAFGPAADGGFWLFGANRALPPGLLAGIGYSRDDTGARLLEAVRRLGAVERLPVLHDLDTAEDLPSVRAALHALATPLPEQRRLATLLGAPHGDDTAVHHG